MKRAIIIAIATATYGMVGLIERGWFDWQGMLTVGLLIAAVGTTVPKKAKSRHMGD